MRILLWLSVLAALVGSVYFFSPVSVRALVQTGCRANNAAFARAVADESKWRQWWPGEVLKGPKNTPVFRYNHRNYTVVEKRFTSLVVAVSDGAETIPTELLFLPAGIDSVHLVWQAAGAPSYNFLTRAKRLFASNALQNDLNAVLQKLKEFHQNESNLYGLKIEKALVQDSNLVATSVFTPAQPGTETVYALVEKLQAFVKAKSARQTGPPMLNVSPAEGGKLRVQVALPVDKKLPDEGEIHYRWMLGRGNILVSEVKGGPFAVSQALAQMDSYVNDYRRVAPAIPFQSLVTDRRQQPDTSKWITKVYWPVM